MGRNVQDENRYGNAVKYTDGRYYKANKSNDDKIAWWKTNKERMANQRKYGYQTGIERSERQKKKHIKRCREIRRSEGELTLVNGWLIKKIMNVAVGTCNASFEFNKRKIIDKLEPK